MAEPTSDDALLKAFLAEVSEVERDNEVNRVLTCFKLNPFEHLNLPFDSQVEDVKKQYRKISLMIHPDKCKHPQAKEAFAALAKAQESVLNPEERSYLVSQFNAAKDELLHEQKKRLKKDNAAKLRSMVDEDKPKVSELTPEFREKWKMKVREMLADQEWRRRKMQKRITEEEGRIQKDEEATKEEILKTRKRDQQWEETRETRVSSWRDFMKGGKKVKKGELKPPKLKTEDPNKSYVQRPVKR